MAVPVTVRPIFKAGVPRRLFDGRFDWSNTHQHYSAGAGRFLKNQRDQGDERTLAVRDQLGGTAAVVAR